jgi:hypothetical protein
MDTIWNIGWRTGSIPGKWKEAIISPIFKKGNRIEWRNCRGVSLLNSSYKIYAKILSNTLNKIGKKLF